MTEEWKLQTSFKTPSGTLINVRSGSGSELEILLGDISELANQISAVEKALGVAHTLSPLGTTSTTHTPVHAQNSPPVSTGDHSPTSAPPTQATSGPTCVHGPRKHKSGISAKTGNPYSMWVCPQPQGADQCRPAN